MIVNEKGLLRAMKEAWKHGGGYNVAVELDLANVVNMVIGTGWWTVIIAWDELPRKVLGMVAEHLGTLPKAGEAFRVMDGEPQTEIFGVASKGLRVVHEGDPPVQLIRRTELTVGGYPLWQRVDDGKVFRLSPDGEDLLLLGKGTPKIVDRAMMMDDMVSRAYVAMEPEPEDQKTLGLLAHLGKVKW